jgi:flagellar basal-body rod protein FlgB
MSIGAVSDSVTAALHSALNGLEARQKVISSNIANVETPGYQARVVSFEDSLRAAIVGGDPSSSSYSVSQSVAPTRANGNNVNIDFEMLAQRENVLRQKLVVQAVNAKYSLLRTAIGQ